MNDMINALMYCISNRECVVQEQKEFNMLLAQAGLPMLYRDEYKILMRNRSKITTHLKLDESLDDGKIDRPFVDADEALGCAEAYERSDLYSAMNLVYQIVADETVDCSYLGRRRAMFRAANTAYRLMCAYNQILEAEQNEALLRRMI